MPKTPETYREYYPEEDDSRFSGGTSSCHPADKGHLEKLLEVTKGSIRDPNFALENADYYHKLHDTLPPVEDYYDPDDENPN